MMMGKVKNRIVEPLRWSVLDLFYRLKLIGPDFNHKPGGAIMAYHGVTPKGGTQFNSKFISVENFEKQVCYFKKNFDIVPLSYFFNNKLNPKKYSVALTFDDGFENNYKYVLPIIEKYQIPVTFFVTGILDTEVNILWADCLDIGGRLHKDKKIIIQGREYYKGRKGVYYSCANGGSLKSDCKRFDHKFKQDMMDVFMAKAEFTKDPSLEDYWKLLSDEQIRKLSKSKLITIGSHGYYHNNLDVLPFSDACNELIKTKEYLQNITQQEVNSLAYPDGAYTRELIDFSYNLGHSQQLAVEYLYEDDVQDFRILDRFGNNPYISWNNQILALLNGRYVNIPLSVKSH